MALQVPMNQARGAMPQQAFGQAGAMPPQGMPPQGSKAAQRAAMAAQAQPGAGQPGVMTPLQPGVPPGMVRGAFGQVGMPSPTGGGAAPGAPQFAKPAGGQQGDPRAQAMMQAQALRNARPQ